MLDQLAAAEDKKQWLENYGTNGKSKIPEDVAKVYWDAKRYMLHAPVLGRDEVTGKVKVVPLNPLPEGVEDLGEYL